MSEVETVVVVDDKKFYSVTRFVNDFKTKTDLSRFDELAVCFDVDEMFDCKVGSIAVKPLLILCGGASDGKNKAFTHKNIIDLFGNVQPIITYKASKTKARPNKANGNVWYLKISLETQTYNEIVYYPMNVLMSSNERIINAMYEHMVSIKYKNDVKKKILRTKEIEVDL